MSNPKTKLQCCQRLKLCSAFQPFKLYSVEREDHLQLSQNVRNTVVNKSNLCALGIKYRFNPISYCLSSHTQLQKSVLGPKMNQEVFQASCLE